MPNRFQAREIATFNSDISRGARCLYLALDEYARESGICWPRQRTLAARLGCSIRQLIRYFHELSNAGLCSIHRSTPGGSNRYSLFHISTEGNVENVRNHMTPVSPPRDMDVTTHVTPVSAHIRNNQGIESEKKTPPMEIPKLKPQCPRCGDFGLVSVVIRGTGLTRKCPNCAGEVRRMA